MKIQEREVRRIYPSSIKTYNLYFISLSLLVVCTCFCSIHKGFPSFQLMRIAMKTSLLDRPLRLLPSLSEKHRLPFSFCTFSVSLLSTYTHVVWFPTFCVTSLANVGFLHCINLISFVDFNFSLHLWVNQNNYRNVQITKFLLDSLKSLIKNFAFTGNKLYYIIS